MDGLQLSFPRVFQSTHPRGVRQQLFQGIKFFVMFQSTHPRGVRLLKPQTLVTLKAGFNPRTREGCDALDSPPQQRQDVSIHAPARGATTGWQPTCTCQNVSIHAPARGATSRIPASMSPDHGFNPRTREGCDWCIQCRHICCASFQSTHPRGVRHGRLRKIKG